MLGALSMSKDVMSAYVADSLIIQDLDIFRPWAVVIRTPCGGFLDSLEERLPAPSPQVSAQTSDF